MSLLIQNRANETKKNHWMDVKSVTLTEATHTSAMRISFTVQLSGCWIVCAYIMMLITNPGICLKKLFSITFSFFSVPLNKSNHRAALMPEKIPFFILFFFFKSWTLCFQFHFLLSFANKYTTFFTLSIDIAGKSIIIIWCLCRFGFLLRFHCFYRLYVVPKNSFIETFLILNLHTETNILTLYVTLNESKREKVNHVIFFNPPNSQQYLICSKWSQHHITETVLHTQIFWQIKKKRINFSHFFLHRKSNVNNIRSKVITVFGKHTPKKS